MFKQLLLIFFVFLLNACSKNLSIPDSAIIDRPVKQPVKNVIIMIGDGMGAEHRRLAQLIYGGEPTGLSMDSLPVKAQVRTAAFEGMLTDSAAAATAMATGHKTRNGIIGLSAELVHLDNIVEAAKAQGKATGLVTTTQLTHATPAAFIAHTGSRKNMLEIARQISLSEIDVLMGGGEIYFLPSGETGCFQNSGKRQDGLNLIEMLQSSGYFYICNENELNRLNTKSPRRVLGLFADEDMRRPFSPDLALMTQKSIEVLSQYQNGFFLMVEGGQIDWASHANQTQNVMQSLRGFDQAVQVARNFALSRDDTLLIVTADHETGGLQINMQAGDEGPFVSSSGEEFYLNWTTHDHTPVNVPLTAAGPASGLLQGEIDNTYIYQVMLKVINSAVDE